VVHIVSEVKREFPEGGYELDIIAELRDARVQRNRHHHRGPIRIRFAFQPDSLCPSWNPFQSGAKIKVWLHSPEKRGEPFTLFFSERRAEPRE
jgi:hypothetical protein